MLITGAPGVLPAIPEENAAEHVGLSERAGGAGKRVGGCGDVTARLKRVGFVHYLCIYNAGPG